MPRTTNVKPASRSVVRRLCQIEDAFSNPAGMVFVLADDVFLRMLASMNRENRPLHWTDNWVEFEKESVDVHQDFRENTNHFIKKNWKITTCNRLDLETLVFRPIVPKIKRSGRFLKSCRNGVCADNVFLGRLASMNGDSRPLLTDDRVEFEKESVDVHQDFRENYGSF